MAITVDTRNAGAQGSSVSSLSWTHTVNAGSNIMLITGAGEAGSGTAVTGVNWDDGGTPAALGKLGNATENDGNGRAELWYLQAPVTGAKTIKVSWAGVVAECGAGSASYFGVDQSGTPFNAASPQTNDGGAGGANSISIAVTSATGEMCVDAMMINDGATGEAPTKGASQTQIYNRNLGSGHSQYAGSDRAGAASATMSWTWTSVNSCCQIAGSMKPAAAATAGLFMPPTMAGLGGGGTFFANPLEV